MKNINKNVSITLKTLRSKKGWSLDKTAQETGVSKAMLGQIERGESSPTIATLWKIASGFQTSFSSFLEDFHIKSKESIHRSAQMQNLDFSEDEEIHVTTLFPFDTQLHCEIFVIELPTHSEHLSLPHDAGVIEHVIVIDGVMEVLSNGIWQVLRKGEGLRFNADQSHGYRNATAENVRFHNIIHYPI